MNIIRMTGGLGNQMFQYALYLKLKSHGREVKMDDRTQYKDSGARPVMLWCFDIIYPKASEREVDELTDGFMELHHRVRRKLFGRKSLEYAERSCNFDRQVLERDPAYLTGYFQSEQYFGDIEDLVRSSFTFSDKIWEGLSAEFLEKMKGYQRSIDESLAVSVHIRRGDYLDNEEAYGNICTEAYYRKAIDLVRSQYPQAVFFFFSNEPLWVREWLKSAYSGELPFEIIEGTDESTGYLDLFLMSRCRHHIIANSSFSWWGAWLNPDKKKLVIAPAKWHNKQDYQDIYTEGMMRITPKGEQVGNGKRNAGEKAGFGDSGSIQY